MKKLLPILLASMAVSTFAEETSASINTLGILRVDSTLEKTIVAVPWVELSGSATEAAVKVADYVKTENLSDGDMLHAYDATTGVYKNWTLTNNAWSPVATATEGDEIQESLAANAYGLTYGSALWLERQNPTANGVAVPFYLSGQVAAAAATHPFVTGTADAPVWNLVANGSATALSLGSITGGGDDDVIYLVNDDDAPTVCYKKNGVWGSDQYVEVRPGRFSLRFVAATAENSTIPAISAGTGFWYVSKSATAPVIP